MFRIFHLEFQSKNVKQTSQQYDQLCFTFFTLISGEKVSEKTFDFFTFIFTLSSVKKCKRNIFATSQTLFHIFHFDFNSKSGEKCFEFFTSFFGEKMPINWITFLWIFSLKKLKCSTSDISHFSPWVSVKNVKQTS